MSTPALDLNDIQGDIVLGLPKRFEDFIFFQITNGSQFKRDLKALIPAITTTADVLQTRREIAEHKAKGLQNLFKVSGINIAFSSKGLTKLNIANDLGDDLYTAGQLSRAKDLGDPGTLQGDKFDPDWLKVFKGDIDGVLLVTGDSKLSVEAGVLKLQLILGKSIKEVFKVEGNVRPGKEKGHEHFGFLDGISVPTIESIVPALPGQQPVLPGILLLGQNGDRARPAWAKNGSFLVYRQLDQLVPEFDKFLTDNPIVQPGLTREQGSALLGARMVGRWKSGAPVDVVPTHDDPALAADPLRNNKFDFSKVADQSNCPFAAHIRKTNPRSDVSPVLAPDSFLATRSINRSGIPYGPEVTRDEQRANKTKATRGLAFVCYQSTIANGFEFIQRSWANTTEFPFGKTVEPGHDPIIGQHMFSGDGSRAREMSGTNSQLQSDVLKIPTDFVLSKGGEYFFSPSISALKSKFSA